MNRGRFFWWLRTPVERRFTFLTWAVHIAGALILSSLLIQLAKRDHWALTGYAILAAGSITSFRALSHELWQLARNEALRLLPGFPAALRRGVFGCHALLTAVGALLSLYLQSWLPVVTTAYAGAVAACLILPAASSGRRLPGDRLGLQQLGADHISWRAMLALVLPALALQALPEAPVLATMAGLALLLLLALPRQLAAPPAPVADVSSCSVWRKPSLAVFGCALLLLTLHFLPSWNSGRNSLLLFAAIPAVGLTALGRQATTLRSLLGRMWLAGMSRRQLCLHGIGQLSLALAQELAIYFGVLLGGYALGATQPGQLFSAGFMVLTFGLMNGLNGLEEILHGRTNEPSATAAALRRVPKLLTVWLPYLLTAIVCLSGTLLTAYGALAVLSLIAGLGWCVRDHLRRFATSELW